MIKTFPTAQELQEQQTRIADAQTASREANAYKDPEQRFGVVLADIREADAEEALNMPPRLTIQQVWMRVQALLADCDGDTSCALQQCLETIEADMREPELTLPDPGWRDGPFTTV